MAFLSTNTLFSFPITHLAIVLRDPGNILLRYPLLSDKIIWLVALAAKYYMYIVTAGGGGGGLVNQTKDIYQGNPSFCRITKPGKVMLVWCNQRKWECTKTKKKVELGVEPRL